MKILYAAAEISPFARMTHTADLLRFLPASLQDKGYEIRLLLPKYGSINDRRNRLHEVIRLAGIKVQVADKSESMRIKVASIPNAKLQVYFLDNDTYFKRKGLFTDPKTEAFFPDNDERLVFYNKGVLETVKKLGWKPDVIHCHDWASGFVPVFLKSIFKDDDNFSNTRVVFNIHSAVNHGVFPPEILDIMNLPEDFDRDSVLFDGNVDFLRAGMKYADHVVTGNELGSELDDTFSSLGITPDKIQGAPQDVSSLFADYYKKITE
ncbi:glycogen/starch synthase [Balneolaceae bacterium ANBcel3]|nr:glycogen/starch synthase [Balneolaceae bacterium ANBcel3]